MIQNSASLCAVLNLMAGANPALAAPAHSTPPIRDPNTPGYVTGKELPDGTNPPADADGNFIIGPTHNRAPEMTVQTNVPQGTVYDFTMSSADSKIYPGIAREPGTFGTVDPTDPAKLVVTTSHPAPYTRKVSVYVPKQYVPGTVAPFIVGADGPDRALFTALDNLIAEKKVPGMIAVSIGNGSGDAQGSERGLEYDTMSGVYAEFVEQEVLPLVEKQCHVNLTKDPEGRATMGGSSGGSCALIMAWYHPDLYHRVLTYSGTDVNQQWPHDAGTPHGAWEFHEYLIPNSPAKPLRIWMEVGDRDLFNWDFPFGFSPTTGVDCFFVILLIFVLLHSFATHFFSPPPVFSRRGRWFDAILCSNAHFLPEMKTPPPLLPWFSCDSFHFYSS